jgi:hypothetical protein
MKKLTFSFILVIGFCFGFSNLSAQSDLSVGVATLAKQNGISRTKDQITAGIQQKLPVLYHELNQSPIDPVTEKMKTVEAVLYKGMLSDLLSGKAVSAAYNDNIAIFLMDFPQAEGNIIKKKEAIDAFHSIVFLN